jgi:hypothetical protein
MAIEATNPFALAAKVAEYRLRLAARPEVHGAQIGQADDANHGSGPDLPAAHVNGLEATSH